MKKILGIILAVLFVFSVNSANAETKVLASAQDATGVSEFSANVSGFLVGYGCDVAITSTGTVRLEGRVGNATYRTITGSEVTTTTHISGDKIFDDIQANVTACTGCEVTIICTWW